MILSRLKRASRALGPLALLLCAGCAAAPIRSEVRAPDVRSMRALPSTRADVRGRFNRAVARFRRWDGEGPLAWSRARCEESSREFEALHAEVRRFDSALYMAGLVAERCGWRERAVERFRGALEAGRGHCRSAAHLAQIELDRGDAARAEAVLRYGLRGDPYCAPAYLMLGRLRRQRPAEREEALRDLHRALAVRHDLPGAYEEVALYYLDEAERSPAALDLAERACRRAAEVAPRSGSVHLTWAKVHLRRGDLGRARESLERAIGLTPRLYEAYMALAGLDLEARRYPDALSSYQAAWRLRPGSYGALIGVGASLRGVGRFYGAIDVYRLATRLEPDRPEAYYNLGLLYRDHGVGAGPDRRRARIYFDQFLARARPSSERFAAAIEEAQRRSEAAQVPGEPREP